eukprot:GHRR01032965.1.p1 GENE.GHRR01032965.1~~GHRR01032965.1.p1  ORF type:complete len:462 (+),score=153.04 GHRR01032965.1:420-1805(+)
MATGLYLDQSLAHQQHHLDVSSISTTGSYLQAASDTSNSPFATPSNLATCAQYLEPVLKGILVICFIVTQAVTAAVHPLVDSNGAHTHASTHGAIQWWAICTTRLMSHGKGCCQLGPLSLLLSAEVGLQQCQLQGGDAVAAINILYEVVHLYHSTLGSKEALQDEVHKLQVDVKTANKRIERLQCQNEERAQEAGSLTIKLRQLEGWYRDEVDRCNRERNELSKKCEDLKQRHVQFQHELRRKDGEHEKLQKRLLVAVSGTERRRSSSSNGSSGRISMSRRDSVGTSNGSGSHGHTTVPAAHPVDARRATKAQLEQHHKAVVDAYEDSKQVLEQDNAALRSALQRLEAEHREMLNKAQITSIHKVDSGSSDSSSGDTPSSTATAAPGPIAALQHMHSQLKALEVRKQRITAHAQAFQLQDLQSVRSAKERLLLVQLLEASKIINEQETALATALQALPSVS